MIDGLMLLLFTWAYISHIPENTHTPGTKSKQLDSICRDYNCLTIIGLFCNCLSCFITARITFTRIITSMFNISHKHRCFLLVSNKEDSESLSRTTKKDTFV